MESHPLTDLPLAGLHLIEASAGTGKTTSLTLLFLRAILDGTEIEKILVVTFTEAAAEEVKGRIHDLLSSARRKALGGEISEKMAPFLNGIRPDQAGILSRALFDFDRATMTTIHSFCRRLLREYAFEFAAPFSLELEADSARADLFAQSEIWRRRVYPETPEVAGLIATLFPSGPEGFRVLSPDATLYRECERAWGNEPKDPDEFLERRSRWLTLLSACRGIDPERVAALRPSFEELERRSFKRGRKKGNGEKEDPFPHTRTLESRLQEIVSGVSGELPGWGAVDERLRHALLELPEEAAHIFLPVRRILSEKEDLSRALRDSLQGDLLAYLRTEALSERECRGVETFDDMILRVLEGLLSDSSGSLSRRIRDRFPVAFVDEFQDTDLAQLRIFDRIYRMREGLPEEAGKRPSVFLVGDPKQSIYRFRGADITAYLEARDRAILADRGALVTLSVNFRSDFRHVEALNHLFGIHEDPFRTGGAIGYDPVRAHHEGPSRFYDPAAIREGEPIPVLLYGGAEGEKREDFARRAAGEIRRLIGGSVTIDGRPVRPDEIAVLVRTHSHGKEIQEELERRGIPSVTYGTESVLETDEAFDLEMLLLALSAPEDRRQIRLVLASRFFGLTARDLRTLETSPDLWNRRVDPLFRAISRWERLGAMGTLRSLFLEEEIFSRLLRLSGGRRRVAHLLHLFEILEEMGEDRPPLLLHVDRYLSARREGSGKKEDRTAPRLESFDGRIRILTLHKAKGLEFPVVLLPFGLSGKKEAGEEEEEETDEFSGGESEEMRLLYVALTRAVHRSVLMVPSRTMPQPALGHLLGLSLPNSYGKANHAAFEKGLDSLILDRPDLFSALPEGLVEPLPPLSRLVREAPLEPPLSAPVLPTPWRMESFSSLLRRSLEMRGEEEAPFALRAEDEGTKETLPEEKAEDPSPAGPLFGSYFHRIMERLADPGSLPADLEREAIPESLLVSALSDLGLSRDPETFSWPESVRPLVERTLRAELTPGEGPPLTLSRVLRKDRAAEREFMMPTKGFSSGELASFLLPEGPRLTFDSVTGTLRGFIDLSFRHRGRYFILDYKTNRLTQTGTEDPYEEASLRRAMAAHRYDLQGLIYALSLHRLLRFSLPGYDYERDFGGAIFLFVRGLGTPGRGILTQRPSFSQIGAFDRLLSGESR